MVRTVRGVVCGWLYLIIMMIHKEKEEQGNMAAGRTHIMQCNTLWARHVQHVRTMCTAVYSDYLLLNVDSMAQKLM